VDAFYTHLIGMHGCAAGGPRTLCEVLSHVEPHVQHTPAFVIHFVLKARHCPRAHALYKVHSSSSHARRSRCRGMALGSYSDCIETGCHTRMLSAEL